MTEYERFYMVHLSGMGTLCDDDELRRLAKKYAAVQPLLARLPGLLNHALEKRDGKYVPVEEAA